jgi:hypothetical protein
MLGESIPLTHKYMLGESIPPTHKYMLGESIPLTHKYMLLTFLDWYRHFNKKW